MQSYKEKEQALYEAILRLRTPEDCAVFFDDLCTRKELEQMVLRLSAAELLMKGATYNDVMREVNISSATLSRISRCVQYGTGYNRFALPPKEQIDSPSSGETEE